MWAAFVLVVLCFGYINSISTPVGRATLKRSQGWEAYAHLAINGATVLVKGLLLTLFVVALLYALASLGYLLEWALSLDLSPYGFVGNVLCYSLVRDIKTYEILVLFFSYVSLRGEATQEQANWKDAFKNQDAILNLIIEAAESQTPIRICLKSRKIYIGLVESEQFERADLDNITIIPYLSGHREKDTLQMVIDHNYISVYQKNKILENKNFQLLTKFRIVLRLNEIESISLFDFSYYDDFDEDET